jgi:hypothetical protein
MKSKQILILAAVFVVLVVAVAISKWAGSETKTKIDIDTLVKEFETAQAGYIEFYHGREPGRKVILERKDKNWTVPSSHGAPADVKRIDSLLGDLRGLKGEVRVSSPSLFSEFKITEEEAVHLIVKDTQGTELTHLLLGKAGPDWRSSFVRKAGDNNVLIVNVSLLSRLGVSRPEKGPLAGFEEDRWLDLTILPGADAEKITTVHLISPHRALSFERVVQEQDKEGGEQEKKTSWKIVQQDVPYAVNDGGINAVLRSFLNRRARDIADPAKESEYGFAESGYLALIKFEDKSLKQIYIGAETGEEGEKKRYLKIEFGALPFLVDDFVVDRLFEDANKLLDLKVLNLPENSVEALTLTAPGRRTVLQRGEKGVWRVAEPDLGFKEQKDAAKRLAQQLLRFEPDDLWNLADTADVPETEYSVIIDLIDGGTRRIEISGIIEGTEDKRYARVDGTEGIFVVSKYTVEKLFPGLASLYSIKLANLDREAISAIEVERGEQKFTLRRNPDEEGKWLLDAYDYTFNADSQKVQQIINYFTNIRPAKVLGKEMLQEYGFEKPTLTVTLKDARGAATIIAGGREGTQYYATEPESGLVFTVVDKAFEAANVKLSQLATLRIFPLEAQPDSIQVSGSAGEFKAHINLKLQERRKGEKVEKVWVTREGREVDRRLAGRLISTIKSRLLATDIVGEMKELPTTSTLEFITLGVQRQAHTLMLWATEKEEKMRYCVFGGRKGYLLVRQSLLEPIFKQAAQISKPEKKREPDKDKKKEGAEESPANELQKSGDKGK